MFSDLPDKPLPVSKPVITMPMSSVSNCLGRHYFVDCTIIPKQLNLEALRDALVSAVKIAEATILAIDSCCHPETGEITVMVMISESHFCIHYLPAQKKKETGSLIFDGHTCGQRIDPREAYRQFAKILSDNQHADLVIEDSRFLQRDIVVNADEVQSLSQEAGLHFCPGMAFLDQAEDQAPEFLYFFKDEHTKAMQARYPIHQIVGGLYRCDPNILNDAEQIVQILCAVIAKLTNGMAVKVSQHLFDPPGVSAVLSAPRIHATAHTWPAYGLISCDIMYILQKHNLLVDPEQAMKEALQELANLCGSQSAAMNYMPRGIPLPIKEIAQIY